MVDTLTWTCSRQTGGDRRGQAYIARPGVYQERIRAASTWTGHTTWPHRDQGRDTNGISRQRIRAAFTWTVGHATWPHRDQGGQWAKLKMIRNKNHPGPPPDLCSKLGGDFSFSGSCTIRSRVCKASCYQSIIFNVDMLRQTKRQHQAGVCFADNKWNQMDDCQLSLTSI